MRNRYAKGQRTAALAGILALALVAGSGHAWAQDDEDEPLDTKLFRSFMREMVANPPRRRQAARPGRTSPAASVSSRAGPVPGVPMV